MLRKQTKVEFESQGINSVEIMLAVMFGLPIVSPEAAAEFEKMQHGHQCPKCGEVWYHKDADAARCDLEEFDKMHACPVCGTRQTLKLAGTY